MSAEQTKVIAKRFEELFNDHDLSIADEIFSPNFQSSLPGAPPLDKEGWKAYVQTFWDAFPDLYQETHDVIATEDRLVLRLTYRGSHQAAFQGIPPTGKPVAVRAFGVNHIENGAITVNLVQLDVLGLLQQLGAIPS